MANVSLSEFFASVAAQQEIYPDWRYGQTCFNTLLRWRPDLAERVRGTDQDPFHARNNNDPRMVRFMRFLAEEWEDA